MDKPKLKRWIPVNEAGRRIGEAHPQAKLSDSDVELMRQLHETYGFGARRLARCFKVSVQTAHNTVHYLKRNQWAASFKPVTPEGKPGS